MPNREIKTTLKLEGAQAFKKAMNDAASSIKVLNSEQKLANATFKATGDAQKYLADKADILRRKMEEQKKAVDAAQQAVDKLNKLGVSKNSSEMQHWQTKLNSAKTSLANMQAELNKTEAEISKQGEAFDEAGDAAKGYGNELQGIGKGVNFEIVINGIERMRKGLEGLIKAAANAGKAVWDAERQAGQWADDVITSASVGGFGVEEYQQMLYASQFVDTDASTIVSARQRLLKNMQSETEDTVKAFHALGIVTRHNDGTLRDQNDVFYEAIDALGRITNETERDAIAMQIFGRGARELNPLIEAGSKGYRAYMEEAKTWGVVAEENVRVLGELDDANNRLIAVLDKTKYDVLAELAPVFTDITDAMAQAVKSFDEFLQTAEGQAALDRLKEALQGIVDAFLNQDFSSWIDKATAAIEGFTGALEWIGNNGGTVVGVLEGMVAALAAMKVSETVLKFMQLAGSIKWLQMSKALNGGGGNGQPGPTVRTPTPSATTPTPANRGVASPQNMPTVRDTTPVFKDVPPEATAPASVGYGALLKGALFSSLGPLTGLGVATAVSYGLDKANVEQTYGEANRIAETAIEGASEAAQLLRQAVEAYKSDDARQQYDFLTQNSEAIRAAAGWDPVSANPAAYAEGFNGFKGIDKYPADMARVIEALNEAAQTAAETTSAVTEKSAAFATSLEDQWAAAEESAKAHGEAIEAAAEQTAQTMDKMRHDSLGARQSTLAGDKAAAQMETAIAQVEAAAAAAPAITERFKVHADAKLKELTEAREALEAAAETAAASVAEAEPTDYAAQIEAIFAKAREEQDAAFASAQEQIDAIGSELTAAAEESAGEVYGQMGEQLNAQIAAENEAIAASLEAAKAQLEADLLGTESTLSDGAQAAGAVVGPMMDAGIASGADAPVSGAATMSHGVIGELQKPGAQAGTLGSNAAIGLANGINAGAGAAISAARALAAAVTNTLRSALRIASPSKVMAELGGYTAEGFAYGIERGISQVERASGNMAAAARQEGMFAPRYNAPAGGRENGQTNSRVVRPVIMMDKTVVGEMIAPVVDEVIGAALMTRR